MSIKIILLKMDDDDYSKLVYSIVTQLEKDLDSDCPIEHLNSTLLNEYSYMVADILRDPFYVEQCFNYPLFSNSEDVNDAAEEIELIYLAIEHWIDEMSYKYQIDTLLDVRLVNRELLVMGEKNVRKKISFDGVGEWNTRFVQRNTRTRAA